MNTNQDILKTPASPSNAALSTSRQEVETSPPATTEREQITLAPETIKKVENALFVLWLKIAATLIAARLVVLVWPVLILLIISLMLVAAFTPLVRRLQKRLTRGWAITTVVFGILFLFVGIMAVVIPPLFRQARNLLTNLPQYLTQAETSLRKMGIPVQLKSNFDLTERAASLGPETVNLLLSVFNGVTGVLTIVVLTTYFLIEGQKVAGSLLGLLPRHQRLLVRQMFGEIGGQIGDYMRGQLITSALAGLFTYLFLLVLGVREPLALGFVMAVADAVPIVGPLLGTVPAVLMALTKDTTTAVIVMVGFFIYQQVENHIIIPRVYSTTLKMSSSVIIIALLIGGTLMGVLGALLALPTAAAIPVVYRYFHEWRQREEERQAAEEGASNSPGENGQSNGKLP
jgi:predicted PurR-regulated permease PerM